MKGKHTLKNNWLIFYCFFIGSIQGLGHLCIAMGQTVQRDVLKNWPYGGPKGEQILLRGAAPKESLITQGQKKISKKKKNFFRLIFFAIIFFGLTTFLVKKQTF